MSDDADNRAARWARIDQLWHEMHAARHDAGSEMASAVEQAVLAQEKADGLYDLALTSLPPDRLVVAQTLVAELQANVCVIVDANEAPARYREAWAIDARYTNIRLYIYQRRCALILLPPVEQATTADASQTGTPKPVTAPTDTSAAEGSRGEKILWN